MSAVFIPSRTGDINTLEWL